MLSFTALANNSTQECLDPVLSFTALANNSTYVLARDGSDVIINQLDSFSTILKLISCILSDLSCSNDVCNNPPHLKKAALRSQIKISSSEPGAVALLTSLINRLRVLLLPHTASSSNIPPPLIPDLLNTLASVENTFGTVHSDAAEVAAALAHAGGAAAAAGTLAASSCADTLKAIAALPAAS